MPSSKSTQQRRGGRRRVVRRISGRLIRTRAERRIIYRYFWESINGGFWFAPVLMSMVALLLASAMFQLDSIVPNEEIEQLHIIVSGTPSELRNLLIGLSGTILTTAGVVFTLLTLPLSTVATQYGSRLLRVYLGDRITQFVLGMFVATFVYCISAAIGILPVEIEPDAPQITATMGLFLTLTTFASLIVLIQHISTMLQAPNIAAAAAAKLTKSILARAPDEVGESDGDNLQSEGDGNEIFDGMDGHAVRLDRMGYLQYIDLNSVLTIAEERDLYLRLLCKPGDFVHKGMEVARIWPSERAKEQPERLIRLIRRAFRVGDQRTVSQDIEYAFKQLVEMAVRAMSPAINDPFTAKTCLDYIGHGLTMVIQQGEQSPELLDSKGNCRVLLEPINIDELFDISFNMIRHASCDNTEVLLHMLKVIELIGIESAGTPEATQMLLEHAGLVHDEGRSGSAIDKDKKDLESAYLELENRLKPLTA